MEMLLLPVAAVACATWQQKLAFACLHGCAWSCHAAIVASSVPCWAKKGTAGVPAMMLVVLTAP